MPSIKKLVFAALLCAAASACSTDPVRVEEDYGKSVRHMIDAQLADPQAARNPSAELPGGLDGGKGDKAIEAYRKPPPASGGSPSTVNFFRIGR
jgi:type IV pilus biogenesis protein CpaD/CtpE